MTTDPSNSVRVSELERVNTFLKYKIRALEERCAQLELRAHDPVDIRPAIQEEVTRKLN